MEKNVGEMGEKWDVFRQLPNFSRIHFSKGGQEFPQGPFTKI